MSQNPNQDAQEKESELFHAYLDALRIMGRCAAEVSPSLGSGVHETLLRLRRRLAFDSRSQALWEAHDVLETTVRDFGRRAKENLDRQNSESSNLLQLANQTADLLAARDRSHLELLRDITRSIQLVPTCEDLGESRESSTRVAFTLTQLTENFHDDSAIALSRFRTELKNYAQRKKEADETTALDPVTGLYSRREVEHRLRQALTTERQFCILKLGIHEFSGLSEEHGVQGMNALVTAAADKLIDQVRPRDVVGQWDPLTFMLLFYDCKLETADVRAQQISNWLSGDYRLMVNGIAAHGDVRLTAAATEVQPGESEAEFVERAGALSPVLLTV